MKKIKRPDSDVSIVQLLGDKPKELLAIEKAIYEFCSEKGIKVIVRRVTETKMSQNYPAFDGWIFAGNKTVKK